MACPYFMPVEKLENGEWLHASRLPLGCGWSGHCTAPGREGEIPGQAELEQFCNLGYAEGCGRLPRERVWDSVRFGARTAGSCVQVCYVCERDHRPVENGSLRFDAVAGRWEERHTDSRVQRMAECFVVSYMAKKKKPEMPCAAAS